MDQQPLDLDALLASMTAPAGAQPQPVQADDNWEPGPDDWVILDATRAWLGGDAVGFEQALARLPADLVEVQRVAIMRQRPAAAAAALERARLGRVKTLLSSNPQPLPERYLRGDFHLFDGGE